MKTRTENLSTGDDSVNQAKVELSDEEKLGEDLAVLFGVEPIQLTPGEEKSKPQVSEDPKVAEEASSDLKIDISDEPKEDKDETTTDGDAKSDTNDSGDDNGDTDVPATTLSDRIKEFEQTNTGPDTSYRGQLTQLEQGVLAQQAELQHNFLEGLPNDGIFVGLYGKTQEEANDYIVKLQDEGRAYEAGLVQTNYQKAQEGAAQYYQKLQSFNQAKEQLFKARNFVEWQEVKTEVTTKLPELTQADFDAIGQFVDQKAQQDSAYYAALQTKEGKLQKGVEALNSLGILKRLKEAEPAKEETKQPSAPDARAVSKKVKTTHSGDLTNKLNQARSMKQADFNKLSDAEIEKLLMASVE